jgi:hypothetical protein
MRFSPNDLVVESCERNHTEIAWETQWSLERKQYLNYCAASMRSIFLKPHAHARAAGEPDTSHTKKKKTRRTYYHEFDAFLEYERLERCLNVCKQQLWIALGEHRDGLGQTLQRVTRTKLI